MSSKFFLWDVYEKYIVSVWSYPHGDGDTKAMA